MVCYLCAYIDINFGRMVNWFHLKKIENYNQTSKKDIALSSQILNKCLEISDFHITHPKNYKH